MTRRIDTRTQRQATDRALFTGLVDDAETGRPLAAASAASLAACLLSDIREAPESYRETYDLLYAEGRGLAPLFEAAGGLGALSHLDPRRLSQVGVHLAESVWKHVNAIRAEEREVA